MPTRTAPFFLVALVAGACSSGKGSPTPVVLAQGQGLTITAADFLERANQEAPMTRAGFADPTRRRDYLEKMLSEEVLLAEARRQGLDQTPEFKATVRAMLIQRLFQAQETQVAGTGPVEPGQQEAQRTAWAASLRQKFQVEIRDGALKALDLSAPAATGATPR